MQKKPTKCAKTKFGGKCRKVCDKYWGAISEIEFCTAKPSDIPGYVGSPKDLRAQMGAAGHPKKPPAGSVDWKTGAPCVCTQYRDGATAEDAATTGLCQRKQPEYDGLGGKAIPCRSLHVDSGTTPPKNRCTSDYEYCTAHPPSPPPSPRPPPPPPAVPPGGAVVTIFETEITITGDCGSFDTEKAVHYKVLWRTPEGLGMG